MIPRKLKAGNHIRVVSPSRSMSIISEENRWVANHALKEMGLTVSYAEHASELFAFGSGTIASRVSDLHAAFSDKKVNGILTTIGGFNSNQLLPHLNYKLIKKNPKVICGFSDITALNNAIYAKTGMVTYIGPHYSTFGMKHGNGYTIDHFKKCVMDSTPFEVRPSIEWSDDLWFLDQEKRMYNPNPGWSIIQEGKAKGTIVGGNIGTFSLLQGTPFMPNLKNTILCIEDDESAGKLFDVTIDRLLQSLLQQKGADKIRGILIGRAQKSTPFPRETIDKIISTKQELANIPVIANVDFGHTSPLLTLPIGGNARIVADKTDPRIIIEKH